MHWFECPDLSQLLMFEREDLSSLLVASITPQNFIQTTLEIWPGLQAMSMRLLWWMFVTLVINKACSWDRQSMISMLFGPCHSLSMVQQWPHRVVSTRVWVIFPLLTWCSNRLNYTTQACAVIRLVVSADQQVLQGSIPNRATVKKWSLYMNLVEN